MVSKLAVFSIFIILFFAFAGFAEASKLSHWYKTHNQWDDVKDDLRVDWHFTVDHDHPSKHQTFDSGRCGTYFWNVQDEKYCMKEWKEKKVYIRGW